MKNILFLVNRLDAGGAEKVLTDIANALDKSKYSVTVQAVIDNGDFKSRLNCDVKYKSIVKCKNSFLQRFCTYIINFIIPPKLTHKLFIKNKYDYEIAFLEGVPTKIISASPNKKSIKYAWVHTDLCNNFGLNKVHKSLDEHAECYRRFDKIVCVSESVKEAFIKLFGFMDSLVVVYNATDDGYIREKAEELVKIGDKLRVVTVGRIVYEKGYDRLIRIHKRLIDEGFNYELLIVGRGQREELEVYVNQNDLSDSVIFTGFTDNPYKYMKSADLIVFPSRVEGYSTAAVEAVILGKPTVVTNCSGMKEIFGNSEYGLVTDNEEESFYRGMKKMLSDSKMREEYAEKAKIRSKDFSMAARIKKLEELFSG